MILFPLTISATLSFYKTILDPSFSLHVFDVDIGTDVCVNLYADWNGASVIVGIANLSGPGVTNSSALCWTHRVPAHPSTPAANLVVIRSFKENDNFASLPYPYPFQCNDKSEIPSTLSVKLPYGYFEKDIQAMISESLIHASGKSFPLSADVAGEIKHMATVSSDEALETTDTNERVN